jgi:hypothetical protein
MADTELARMGTMIKEAAEFREMMENKYKDLDDTAHIKALLIDVLCLLHVEFYIRPRGE